MARRVEQFRPIPVELHTGKMSLDRTLLICLILMVLQKTSGNIAFRKPARQSSTRDRGEAWKAVDGNRSPFRYQHHSCAHTEHGQAGRAWWYVDLLAEYPIRKVEIVARGEGYGKRFSDWDLIIATEVAPDGFNAADGGTICYSQNGPSVDGQVYDISCNQTVGRYVGIRKRKAGEVIDLCELEVYLIKQATNLALKKRTLQYDTAHGGVSSRAVDGNLNQQYSGQSCTHTSYTRITPNMNNWWAVDLGEGTGVGTVVLYNRADCCGNRLANFDIVVTNQEPTPNQKLVYTRDKICAHKMGAVVQGGVATFTCTNLTGQYVAVVQPRSQPLTLCEVEVFHGNRIVPNETNWTLGKNLALNQATNQFDDYHNLGKSNKAVDGNQGQRYHSDGCTHTNNDPYDFNGNNWWSVDLGRVTAVSVVKLFNRLDCCSFRLRDFDIVVTNRAPVRGQKLTYQPSEVCWHNYGPLKPVGKVTIPCEKQGRYVAVAQPRRDYLTLCEVEVYGTPSVSVPTKIPPVKIPTHLFPVSDAPVTIPTMSSDMKALLNAEHRLITDLLSDDRYDKRLRPVKKVTDTLSVSIGLAAVSSVELNERAQTIAMDAWVQYSWQDVRLQWDPDNYDYVKSIRIPWNDIWRPDITLYNSAGSPSMNPTFEDTNVVVLYTGKVHFVPHVSLKAQCPMDLTNFPLDTQECFFRFGSWTFDGFMLDLVFYNGINTIDFNQSFTTNQWIIQGTHGKRREKYYPCCVEPYPDINYSFKLKRDSSFFLYCGPAILLAFMTPLVFLVPHGTGDKTSLCFCLLLCLLILIASLEDYLQVTKMPLLVYYYTYSFLLVGISFFITILMNNILDGCKTAPPSVLLQTCSGLGKFMCINTGSDKSDMIALVDSDCSSVPQNGTSVRAKWRYIAKVIDRILCLVFVLVVAIHTTAVFAKY